MNIRILPVALASLALIGFATPAHAAKKRKKGAQGERVLAHLDRDHSGAIDGKEARRVQTMFAALSALDTDKDGQLSESELMAAKIPAASTSTTTPKKRKKKTQ